MDAAVVFNIAARTARCMVNVAEPGLPPRVCRVARRIALAKLDFIGFSRVFDLVVATLRRSDCFRECV